MVNISNVVNINLDVQTTAYIGSGYKTTVYFLPVGFKYLNANEEEVMTNVYLFDQDNYAKAQSVMDIQNGQDVSGLVASINSYFENGGIRLLCINPSATTLAGFQNDLKTARTLASDFLFVNIDPALTGTAAGYSTAVLSSIAEYCDTTVASEKIYLCLTAVEVDSTSELPTLITTIGLQNFNAVVKFCTKRTISGQPIAASLLVGAYFSKVLLDSPNSLRDYAYTAETLYGVADPAENVSQTVFEALVNNPNPPGNGYYNFIDQIATHIVNFGGDFSNNKRLALHIGYGIAAVEKDICYTALESMIGKQYLNETGMSNIKAAINDVMQKYRTNGFLNPGAKFSGENVVIEYGDKPKQYSVVSAGQTLPQGFLIYSVPVADITARDRLARRFPPLYIIMETLGGARVLSISGVIRA